MPLNKEDLQKIEQVVDKVVDKKVTKIVDRRVSQSEVRIIKTITREINDLSEINRVFVENFDNHEHRIKKLEIKTGIVS